MQQSVEIQTRTGLACRHANTRCSRHILDSKQCRLHANGQEACLQRSSEDSLHQINLSNAANLCLCWPARTPQTSEKAMLRGKKAGGQQCWLGPRDRRFCQARSLCHVVPEPCPHVGVAPRTYCQERKISYFQAYLAAYYWALHLATGKSDVMVSTTFHGRMEQDLKRVNGNCINILPLRQEVQSASANVVASRVPRHFSNCPLQTCKVSGDMTFDQLVEQVRSNVRSSKRHGQFPFDELQGKQAVLEYMLASYDAWLT